MSQRRRFFLKFLALVFAAVPGAGCTRKFFRQRADRDVEQLLTEKNVFEPWRIENWHVYPDPRARFADPTNPDRPPMPPDDPASQLLAPNPQKPGKAGVGAFEGTGYLELLAAWDAMNRANQPPALRPVEVDKPMGAAALASKSGIMLAQYVVTPDCPPGTIDRPYLINLEQCCELGLINSRDYQTQRENLYLTALPVTLQRYSFAAQLFVGGNAAFQSSGDETGAPGQRSLGNTSAGFSKVFPTGATLLAQVASRFVFDVTNGNPTVGISNLTLELTQPLLNGGGKAVTLEPLTQSERTLLYQVRNYARFRKQFFVNVAAGGTGGGGGTALLDPSLGALAPLFGPTNGYLPTLRLIANLEIDRENVQRFQQLLRLFEALAEGGEVNQLQVDRIKLNVLQGQSTVLNDELQLRNALDTFKIQLGMSPALNLELDTSPIRPIREQLDRFQQPIDQYRATVELIEDSDPDPAKRQGLRDPEQAARLRERLKKIATESDLVKGTPFRERIAAEWGLWERLTDQQLDQRLAQLRDERRKLLGDKTRVEAQGQEPSKQLEDQLAQVESQSRLGAFEKALREYERQPWKQLINPDAAKLRQQNLYAIVSDSFELLLITARTQRFEMAKRSWPELPRACVQGVDLLSAPLETAYTRAAQTALTNRLDLMNFRGEVVDRWRQIAVRANSLLGVFDVGYSVNSGTPAAIAQPLNFSSSRTTQRLTFNGELPLVRRLERNNYRTALINYQRERRELQQQEDTILNNVRGNIRQLRVLAETYKIQQQAVVLNYNQVEQALENFRQPPTPAGVVGPPAGGQQAGTAAALTEQLQQAQQGLTRTQSQIYNIWIQYHTLRMQLFFNLELMPLDARGVWIDEHATQECDPACLPDGGRNVESPARGDSLSAPRPTEQRSTQRRAPAVAPPWTAKR